jgi:hypothetical protein
MTIKEEEDEDEEEASQKHTWLAIDAKTSKHNTRNRTKYSDYLK